MTLSLENDRDINYYKEYRLEFDRNAYPSNSVDFLFVSAN